MAKIRAFRKIFLIVVGTQNSISGHHEIGVEQFFLVVDSENRDQLLLHVVNSVQNPIHFAL